MSETESQIPRIGCLYGASVEPFVADVLRDLRIGLTAVGGELVPITIESACASQAAARPQVEALYVLPFDLPRGAAAAGEEAEFVERLFPEARIMTPFAVQDLCRDKIATQERLLKHGVATPAAIVTDDFAEVKSFVREHRFAILKEPQSCAGVGLFVVWIDDGALVGDCGSHQVRIEPRRGGGIELDGETLRYPAPWYLQRLIVQHGRGMPTPGQVLRAYVVDREVRFWTERLRDSCERPSDWIINAARGARYRFLHDVRHEAAKLALRAAEALGIVTGVIDLVRTQGSGPYVTGADVDSRHMLIDRSFKRVPEFRDFFDFDRYLAQSIVRRLREPEAPAPAPPEPRLRERRPAERHHDRRPVERAHKRPPRRS